MAKYLTLSVSTGRSSRCIRTLAALLAMILWVAPLRAQTVDVAGTWDLSVTTDQGVTTPSVTFQQDGGTLSGSYSSATLGEARVQGSVAGTAVRWSFSANLQGQSIRVAYEGTVAGDGTMSGTIDIAAGMLEGTFTARRRGG
jgi:hypothetical protein